MKQRGSLLLVTLTVGLLSASRVVLATSVTPAEQSEARRWAAAKFEGVVAPKPAEGYLQILDKDGTVKKNEGPGGPLRLASATYQRGLYAGGVSKLAVHLPARGKTFEAVTGLAQDWFGCAYSASSAVYSVEVTGKEAARSAVTMVGGAGVPVKAALGGATEFVLVAGTPENIPACPANVWADARVTLEDGQTLWLDELPVAPVRTPYTLEPQFSFTYGGKPSAELLKSWAFERQVRRLDDQRTEYTLTYKDSQTGLVLRSVGVEYRDYPVVEWTLYFENTGSVDTPILENIRALDMHLERNGEGEFTLHHFKGSQTTPTDYEPYATTLRAKQTKEIVSVGTPTRKSLCYFNVEWPGEGVIVALGWPGHWAADFVRDAGCGLQVQAGQGRTHFKLHPGEKVRTPLVALLFWKGDWIRAQNIWRRWMLAHNVPRPGGKPLRPALSACYSSLTEDLALIDEEKGKLFIDRYLEEGFKLDYWEMDAGWYVNDGHWWNTGTWEPDPKRFPQGLGPLLDFVHAKGLKTHIWFEPERVTRGTWLWDRHPEWLLPFSGDDYNRLLNLGDPQAYQWVVKTLDKYISQGIDFYRTDFNFNPLPFWEANDAPDRVGITEIKHVTGLLNYFDELVRRHPNLLIDICAGGGARNDLEMLRRAIPITRSDYAGEPVGVQNINYGIAFWIPVYGSGTAGRDAYTNRSAYSPRPFVGWDMRTKDLHYPSLRQMTEEWRSLAEYFWGDYYPLAPYNSNNTVWTGWQFDRPDLGAGVAQVFRRAESPYDSARIKLRGLSPDAIYEVKDLDKTGVVERKGRELMEDGLQVSMPEAPTALVFTYRAKPRR